LSYARATQIAATVGQGFRVRVRVFGLLFNPFLIFIALFVYIGASQEAALAQMKDVSRRFPVSSAMVREFRTLAADATLEEAWTRCLRLRSTIFRSWTKPGTSPVY
jgi:hypothetical protein